MLTPGEIWVAACVLAGAPKNLVCDNEMHHVARLRANLVDPHMGEPVDLPDIIIFDNIISTADAADIGACGGDV